MPKYGSVAISAKELAELLANALHEDCVPWDAVNAYIEYNGNTICDDETIYLHWEAPKKENEHVHKTG